MHKKEIKQKTIYINQIASYTINSHGTFTDTDPAIKQNQNNLSKQSFLKKKKKKKKNSQNITPPVYISCRAQVYEIFKK